MRNIPQNTGGISGSRASHRAKSSFVSTKGFDPGRRLYPHLITSTPRKPPIPRGHRQWLDIA